MQIDLNNVISFSWDLHYKCNYRCPYCWWNGRWQDLPKPNDYLSVELWVKYWRNIYNRYGTAHIEILGGEPFIYPNFTELIRELSNIHNIIITTNLSTEITNFVEQIDSSKVKVSPTFHPLFADFESFIKKALLLKQKGFTNVISYLAYPSQIKQISYYSERFNQKGLTFSIMTFWGEYKDISYPEGYTEEEREIIGIHLGKRAGEEFQLIPKKMPKDRLCRAGQRYAVIQGDGNVIRCGGSGLNETIGNFFDENFRLLEKPMPCKAEYCKCNEWAFLLLEDSEHFLTVKDSKNSPQISSPKFPRLAPLHRAHFNWEITYECNYRCSYCNVWREHRERYPYVEIDKWRAIWDRMFEKYGSCHIRFSGGEPFIYSKFIDLIAALLRKHTIDITTNLSFDINTFLSEIKPGGISISASFHSEYVDFDSFLEKVTLLNKKGFPTGIAFVAFPSHLLELNKYKSAAEEKDILFKIIPFNGEFKGQKYPQDYTDEEKRILEKAATDTNNSLQKELNTQWFRYNIQKKSVKDKLCHMGQLYAKIFPDGHITRCCVFDSKCLGNILDNDFRLLDNPEPCDSKESCPCFKAMIVSEECKWLPLWDALEHTIYKIEHTRKIMDDYTKMDPLKTEVKETAAVSREETKDAMPIEFDWILHFKCNYRCPYCFFEGCWEEVSKFNKYYSVEKWIDGWAKIYKKFGNARVTLTGGEPFLYPSFINLVEELIKKHFIGFDSNLSCDMGTLINFSNKIDANKVNMGLSFHPTFAKLEIFLEKALFLKEKGYDIKIHYVAYPPQLKHIEFVAAKFKERGLRFLPLPFRGNYNGVTYPEAYTEKEKDILYNLSKVLDPINKRFCEEQVTPRRTKGKLCMAGQRYAHIEPDGMVYRCSQLSRSTSIGNFFDENFKLLDGSLSCIMDKCPCEFRWLVEK